MDWSSEIEGSFSCLLVSVAIVDDGVLMISMDRWVWGCFFFLGVWFTGCVIDTPVVIWGYAMLVIQVGVVLLRRRDMGCADVTVGVIVAGKTWIMVEQMRGRIICTSVVDVCLFGSKSVYLSLDVWPQRSSTSSFVV